MHARTVTAGASPRRLRIGPWRLRPVVAAAAVAAATAAGASAAALAATGMAATTATTATTVSAAGNGHAPAVGNYRLIQLSPGMPGDVGINARGEVGFSEAVGAATRTKFYDGHTIRDIGTLGGASAAFGALNDHGHITGVSLATGGGAPVGHAYLWSKATGMRDLHRADAPSGVSSGVAINNKGWVAGYASTVAAGTPYRAFRWTPASGLVNLGAFARNSYANAINDAGTVVGYSDAVEPIFSRAFKWTEAGGLQSLVSTASVATVANDINEAGKIVGTGTDDLGFNDRALLWTPQGTQVDLGTDFSFFSYADHINEKDLVIGQELYNSVESLGFVRSRAHGVLRFGTAGVDTSYVADLNNLGQVVGYLNFRAFVWTRSGGTVDLNTRIPGAPPGLTLTSAVAISDNGSIVAVGNTGLVLLVPSAAYHEAPVAAPITLLGATRVNSLLSFSSSFKDVDLRDTHSASWTWGDGSSSVGTVSQAAGSGNVGGQHAYRKTGIYTVRLSVLDSGGKSTAVERKLTICGCSAPVAGHGSFFSPDGAVRGASSDAMRRSAIGGAVASFAYVADGSRPRPGADRAAVEINVADLALRSTAIDALERSANRVQISGTGTVNGKGNYRFTLSTVSSKESGGQDRVRVRISHLEPGTKAEVVDYDNGASPAAAPTKAVVGASLHAEGSVIFDGSLAQ